MPICECGQPGTLFDLLAPERRRKTPNGMYLTTTGNGNGRQQCLCPDPATFGQRVEHINHSDTRVVAMRDDRKRPFDRVLQTQLQVPSVYHAGSIAWFRADLSTSHPCWRSSSARGWHGGTSCQAVSRRFHPCRIRKARSGACMNSSKTLSRHKAVSRGPRPLRDNGLMAAVAPQPNKKHRRKRL